MNNEFISEKKKGKSNKTNAIFNSQELKALNFNRHTSVQMTYEK